MGTDFMTAGATIRVALRAILGTRRRGVTVLVGFGLTLALLWAVGSLAAGDTTIRVLLVLNVGLALMIVALVLWPD